MSKKATKDYFNVAQRKNTYMDQTMPTIIHVSWSKLLGARLRYQQEFYSYRTDVAFFFFNDKL